MKDKTNVQVKTTCLSVSGSRLFSRAIFQLTRSCRDNGLQRKILMNMTWKRGERGRKKIYDSKQTQLHHILTSNATKNKNRERKCYQQADNIMQKPKGNSKTHPQAKATW